MNECFPGSTWYAFYFFDLLEDTFGNMKWDVKVFLLKKKDGKIKIKDPLIWVQSFRALNIKSLKKRKERRIKMKEKTSGEEEVNEKEKRKC